MAPVMPHSDSRQRAERAWQLRCIGRSWRQIRDELGYRSIGAASSAVARHEARRPPESPERSRQQLIETARLTSSILFDRFAAAAGRRDDKTLAMLNSELHRNRDQLARLTGAYLPERTELAVEVRTPAQVLDDYQAELLRMVDAEVIEQPKGITQ